jgi:transcriptional regulator with XRE-family HTH domain
MAPTVIAIEDMSFPQRLTALRKQHSLTQQALAERVGIHVTQLRRYEAGTAQPTLDVLRRIAVSLSVRVRAVINRAV